MWSCYQYTGGNSIDVVSVYASGAVVTDRYYNDYYWQIEDRETGMILVDQFGEPEKFAFRHDAVARCGEVISQEARES